MKASICLTLILFLSGMAIGSENELLSWWRFDREQDDRASDSISGIADEIQGNFKYLEGVVGKCLKFDQYTTSIVRKPSDTPRMNTKSFTIEAWIAPRSYPWNWCPIVMQRDETNGYYFGVDGDGRFGLHVSVDGKWYECNCRPPFPGLTMYHTWNSDERQWVYKGQVTTNPPLSFKGKGNPVVPLLKWSHLVGTFSATDGITIYLNGKIEEKLVTTGRLTPAKNADLRIGRDTKKIRPTHTERPAFTMPVNYSFDGLIDEIKIYNHALSPEEVLQAYNEAQPNVKQPLQFRKIPTGPKGPKPFGAYFTRLKYDEDYDRLWRIGENIDVVVMFDEYPFKLVYWHGINNYPVWYSENDIGIMHEAGETTGLLGCQEALMDRQCRYSRVRVVESTDARVMIHWRHAMNNIAYELIHVDPLTGWGDWCDDYFTIYPDGVAARKLVHWCSSLDEWHSYEQENFVVPIGLTPADILHKQAVTLANLKGRESTFSWEKTGWPQGEEIPNPIILRYNIKAESKPFMVIHPKMGQAVLEGNSRPWPHCFYWWNHWPVAQIPSDGKQLYMVDGRPSSTCITGNTFRTDVPENERTENSLKQFMLFGMTMDKTAGQLAPLARSWAQAPQLEISVNGFENEGYSIAERCYHISRSRSADGPLKFELKASIESPVVNPAFVIKNWPDGDAELKIDGKRIKRGKNFRLGRRYTLKGTDLVVWVRAESMNPLTMTLTPVER